MPNKCKFGHGWCFEDRCDESCRDHPDYNKPVSAEGKA